MDNITDKIASTHLGKKSTGSELYDKSLLVAIPRIENRKQYNLSGALPFCGFDIWHCYEFSVMTEFGVPVTRVLKLRYDCSSEFIVESKSLKLYLNSFNMSRFGENINDCLNICKNIIENDLSNILNTKVSVNFLDNSAPKVQLFENYENILNKIDEKTLVINKFKEAPELLQVKKTELLQKHYLKFDSLRSNCRVTHQPDFGDIFIYYKSKNLIDYSSLVKYLSSFRSEYHFHEECCEMVFKRIFDLLNKEDELFVCALYTRRGGIDITPVRWSNGFEPVEAEILSDISKFVRSGIKQ